MNFNNRSEFINAQSSEKVTLAQVKGRARILPFDLESGTIYSIQVPYVVVSLHNELTELTQASSEAVSTNEFYYNFTTGKLTFDIGSDPVNAEMIATYQFHYSTAPLILPYNLQPLARKVDYQARIQRSPGFKHKIGYEQNLVSIIGNGSLKLINQDGALDEIFDTIIFDNQPLIVYSYNRDLSVDEARPIYRGRITAKRFDSNFVWFEVKDELVDLVQNVSLSVFGEDENVTSSIKNNYKRMVFGRIDGLQLQSVDQIGEGYSLSGTLSGVAGTQTVTGVGTLFLSQLSPDDRVTIDTLELTVDSITNNTTFTVSSVLEYGFSGLNATVKPEVPVVTKNREFFVADHESARVVKTITSINQLNRIELNSTEGLFPGDFVEFETLERLEIKSVLRDNVILLRTNLTTFPLVGSDVIRQPIQEVFIGTERVLDADYTISNSTDTRLFIDADAEYNLSKEEPFAFNLQFTTGSRNVTTTNDVDLKEFFKPRDYVKPNNLSYSNYYEILSVSEQSLELRLTFSQSTINTTTIARRPNYIDDNTIVSANVLGRTDNGLAEGQWLFSAPLITRRLLLDAGLTNINETSFTEASQTNIQPVSMTLPFSPGSTSVTYKQAIDRLASSINAAVTLDNNLDIKMKVLNAEIPENPVVIDDFNVISWGIESISGKNIRNAIIDYRQKDIERFTQEEGAEVVNFTSEFVEKYTGLDNTEEKTIYLYNDIDAEIFAHRLVYNQSVGRTDVDITTDLRYEDIEIGDVVILDFNRMYKRFGDSTTRKKAVIVVGKTLDGTRTQLECTDFGNILNRSSIITPNDAPEWTSANEDEKIKYGYITDVQGIVNDEKDTSNTHLIS